MVTIDLFAGCGGLTAGFMKAGFNVVAAFENWATAIKCYSENFQHPIHSIDLSKINDAITIIQEYNPHMIIGGPPCQDFSHAGKRIEGNRANLTIAFAEIITSIKPKWFVMENVDRTINSKSYKLAREILKSSNYGLTEQILDASLCGVPQKRKRLFSIGLLNGEDNFLREYLIMNRSSKPMNVKEYLGDEIDVEYYYRHPRNYNRRAIYSVYEASPTIRGVNRPIPKGYTGHPNDPVPMTPKIRNLTTYERSLIQTFPKDFKWVGNKTEIEQMIGNAVPINLAYYVASNLMNYIRKEENQDVG